MIGDNEEHMRAKKKEEPQNSPFECSLRNNPYCELLTGTKRTEKVSSCEAKKIKNSNTP